jgi:hypothetical protein
MTDEQENPDWINMDELTESEVEQVMNTNIFRRALAYKRLADGIQALKDDEGEMFSQLVRDVNAEAGGRVKEDTTHGQLQAFVDVVERYTSLVEQPEDAVGNAEDIQKTILDEEGEDSD